MSKKKWTWDDYPIYGRGRGVIRGEGRHLMYGDAVIASAERDDIVNGPEGFAMIPKMCDVLNAHWRENAPSSVTPSEEYVVDGYGNRYPKAASNAPAHPA
ncbi:MAG: hypothetical protein NUW01_03520 [Gemmatimonadaceae bacterium]|nr:hypothetical protein [Gemmatimonadaceae bacterium]